MWGPGLLNRLGHKCIAEKALSICFADITVNPGGAGPVADSFAAFASTRRYLSLLSCEQILACSLPRGAASIYRHWPGL